MNSIVTSLPVDIALRTMNDRDVQTVRTWFNRLSNLDSDKDIRNRSYKLPGLQNDVYLLKTDGDFRIFYKIDDHTNTIMILDVAKRAAIYTSGSIPDSR